MSPPTDGETAMQLKTKVAIIATVLIVLTAAAIWITHRGEEKDVVIIDDEMSKRLHEFNRQEGLY